MRVSSMIRSFSSIVCRVRSPVRRPSVSVVAMSTAKGPARRLSGLFGARTRRSIASNRCEYSRVTD